VFVDVGFVVVVVGGGGILCVCEDDGFVCGVEVVIDKDFIVALLVGVLDVDVLVIVMDVDYVVIGWGML